MRKGEAWRDALARDLQTYTQVYGPLAMPATRVLDTELVLTLLADYFPGEDPARAWTLLNGQPFPALEDAPVTARRAVHIARLRLPRLLGRDAWTQQLGRYRGLAPVYRLYRVEGADLFVEPSAILPERRAAMQSALQTAPGWRARPARYAPAGRYRFTIDRDAHEVEIPGRATTTVRPAGLLPLPAPDPEDAPLRAPILVTLTALQETAIWMDRHAPPGSPEAGTWTERMRDVRLCLVGPGGLRPSAQLTLDGVLHLIGMVGSGKSTLFTVLAVYLARQGWRVVLVQSDVATLLRAEAIIEALHPADPRVSAVPLIGRSTRLVHLNRLHAVQAQETGPHLDGVHPAYAMLSTVCPLDGLRRDVDPIPPGSEPCTNLIPVAEATAAAPRHYDCPWLPVCPTHRATQQLPTAAIWLATPASLLASGPQVPLIPEEVRYAELVMRHADVVLVDEADLVQVQFDARFAPMEVLVGRTDSWLDRLAIQVARQVYRPGRPLVGRSAAFDRWLTAHSNTQQAVNRLYRWLRESAATRQWLQRSYFSGERLLQRVEGELRDQGLDPAPFALAREAFLQQAVGGVRLRTADPEPPAAWRAAVQAELLGADSMTAAGYLAAWLRETYPALHGADSTRVDDLAHHLLIALLVGVLDHALQDVIAEWSAAAEVLELDRGLGGLFYPPSDDLVRLVPEPAMGAVLGFQYFDPDNTGEGDLRFFHIRGSGRALLYHLHDALRLSDGIAGPHVILTSGTSWAPGSAKYDLHVPPGAVLLSNRQEEIAPIECFFTPLTDPDRPQQRLSVSGRYPPAERIRSLKAMVRELSRKRGYGPSLLEAELAQLPPDRQRILLVVGSYEEADAVGEALRAELQAAPGAEVLILQPDSLGELPQDVPADKLLRGLVHQFPARPARYLVAPLRAIERGHNILVGQRAAIGSVYFLVRPHPVPGDLAAAVERMNAWATTVVPTLAGEVGAAGWRLRQQASARWDQLLAESDTYTGTRDRTGLLWTQLVLVWQCIGRLLRGGVPARVHFVDAKWAEVTAGRVAGAGDTEETSMLLGFERILREALQAASPAERAIAEVLYGPFAAALAGMKGIHRG